VECVLLRNGPISLPPYADDHSIFSSDVQDFFRPNGLYEGSKLQEDGGTGGFDLGALLSRLEKPRNRMGRGLDCMVDVLMGLHRSR